MELDYGKQKSVADGKIQQSPQYQEPLLDRTSDVEPASDEHRGTPSSWILQTTAIVEALIIVALVIALLLAHRSSSPGSGSPAPSPVIALRSQQSVLVAAGYKTNNVVSGPTWSKVTGDGIFALDVEHKRVFASAAGYEILLDGTYVYSYFPKTPSVMGPHCRRYTNSIKPTRAVHHFLSFIDQYMCQWINPSPCSWSSIIEFYARFKYTATVPQGSPEMEEIDVYWQNFSISTDPVWPGGGPFAKTVELQFGRESGFMTHLAHWTSNQRNPPFSESVYDISHSDDNAFNITGDVDASLFVPRDYWGNCTLIA